MRVMSDAVNTHWHQRYLTRVRAVEQLLDAQPGLTRGEVARACRVRRRFVRLVKQGLSRERKDGEA